ncbi:hypothetical protein FOA52_003793 [Chlamydomonas sp. UWO 241]|nr:hypothetical protein FOA52_003793 [Chlamydomonas sp. UWO 241]
MTLPFAFGVYFVSSSSHFSLELHTMVATSVISVAAQLAWSWLWTTGALTTKPAVDTTLRPPGQLLAGSVFVTAYQIVAIVCCTPRGPSRRALAWCQVWANVAHFLIFLAILITQAAFGAPFDAAAQTDLATAAAANVSTTLLLLLLTPTAAAAADAPTRAAGKAAESTPTDAQDGAEACAPAHSNDSANSADSAGTSASAHASLNAMVARAAVAWPWAAKAPQREYRSSLRSRSTTFTAKFPLLHLVQSPLMATPEWRDMLRARLERLLSAAASCKRGSCVSLRFVTLDVGAGCVVAHGRLVEGGTWGYSGAEVAEMLQAVDASELLMRLMPPGARLLDGDTAMLQLGDDAPLMELEYSEADERFVRSAFAPLLAHRAGETLLATTWPLLALPCGGSGRVHLHFGTALLGHDLELVLSWVPLGATAAPTPLVRAQLMALQAAAHARGNPPGLLDVDVNLGSSPSPGMFIAQLVDGDALLAVHSVALLPASCQPVVAELLRRAHHAVDSMHDVALDLGVLLCGPRVRTPGDAAELRSVVLCLMAWERTCSPALPALRALLRGLLHELDDGDEEEEASASCSSPSSTATVTPRAHRPPLLWVWTGIIVCSVKGAQFVMEGSGSVAAVAMALHSLPYAALLLPPSAWLFECLPHAMRSVDSFAARRLYTIIIALLTMPSTASFSVWAVYCNYGGDIPLILAWAWFEPPRSHALGAAISLLVELPAACLFRWHALASCGQLVWNGTLHAHAALAPQFHDLLKMALSMKTAGSRVAARNVQASAARPMWYPGASAPKHLDGSMVGDYGFDPLRLGTNPETTKWYQEAELTNGRWAMAAVAGILFTDLVGLPKFWLAGAETYPLETQTLTAVEVAALGVLEAFRYGNWQKTGASGLGPVAPFDPLNMASEQTKLKEVKNARLAMLAFIGFCSQAAVQGKGPIDCLKAHIEDPMHNNIYTSAVGKETVVTIAVLCIWPMIIEVQKTLNKQDDTYPPALFPWAAPWEETK